MKTILKPGCSGSHCWWRALEKMTHMLSPSAMLIPVCNVGVDMRGLDTHGTQGLYCHYTNFVDSISASYCFRITLTSSELLLADTSAQKIHFPWTRTPTRPLFVPFVNACINYKVLILDLQNITWTCTSQHQWFIGSITTRKGHFRFRRTSFLPMEIWLIEPDWTSTQSRSDSYIIPFKWHKVWFLQSWHQEWPLYANVTLHISQRPNIVQKSWKASFPDLDFMQQHIHSHYGVYPSVVHTAYPCRVPTPADLGGLLVLRPSQNQDTPRPRQDFERARTSQNQDWGGVRPRRRPNRINIHNSIGKWKHLKVLLIQNAAARLATS